MLRKRVSALAIFVFVPVWSWGSEWSESGRMVDGRRDHTATLLSNGKILVAGGSQTLDLTSSELYDPGSGTWNRTGGLSTARSRHTATLLPSGEVLVVGGWSAQATAELYSPKQGAWRAAASPTISRAEHTATLLQNGEVLLVGGNSSSVCELYSPLTGLWRATGSLQYARSSHSATLLSNGKVLVVGGSIGGGSLASAELYDPQLGVWQRVGDLSIARSFQTATLLPSGRVLVAGGLTGPSNSSSLNSSEIFDPSDGIWTKSGNLNQPQALHGAVLLPSGKVLVVGGGFDFSAELFDPSTGNWTDASASSRVIWGHTRHSLTLLPSGGVLMAGGKISTTAYLATSEIFAEDSSLEWESAPDLGISRSGHTSTLLASGEVLISGGESDGQGAVASTEIFDPSANSWRSSGIMAVPRAQHTATLLTNGKVLVVGGNYSVLAVDLFDPATGVWTATGSLSLGRYGHSATLLSSGKVLIVGGYVGFSGNSNSAEIYDPLTGTWTKTGSLMVARRHHTATLLASGEVLVVGGDDFAPISSAEIYEPSTGTWSSAGNLATSRMLHTATLLPSGWVLVVGGYDRSAYLSSAEIFEPRAKIWRSVAPLLNSRSEHTANLMPSGKVLVFGGRNRSSYLACPELYDPSTSSWVDLGTDSINRYDHTATLLLSGELLVAGGRMPYSLVSVDRGRIMMEGPQNLPIIHAKSTILRNGESLSVVGTGLRQVEERSGGTTQNSAVNFPLLHLRSFDGTAHYWLTPDSQLSFWDEPMSLAVSELPSSLDPGKYLLSALVAGVASIPVQVEFQCSLVISQHPARQTVALGQTATFTVEALGGRRYKWRKNGVDIPGATTSSYTTPPVTASDAGTAYSCFVDSLCATATSNSAPLVITDNAAPTAAISEPDGGEFWSLSTMVTTNTELVAWEAADNIRVCQVQASLIFSSSGGQTWLEAPAGGGLPASFGQAGPCAYPGVETSSLVYTVPQSPPSGVVGSIYKIRLRVTDQADNTTEVVSSNPFFIVQPNPDSVKTLILHHLPRMEAVQGIIQSDREALVASLIDLSNHPRVQGRLVDLSLVAALSGAFAVWDADPANPAKANAVVSALRDYLRSELLPTYTGIESIVVVGDDRIVPMARLVDATQTPESTYTSPTTGSLTTTSTVGKALSQNYYLSDDLLGIRSALTLPIIPEAFAAGAFIPTLAVGRLVETPAEITKTIATFISQDGVLDLGPLATTTGHKVLVTGYDFLSDSAQRIRERWQQALGVPSSTTAIAPVDGQLISTNWGAGSVGERRTLLWDHLSGNGGPRYALNNLNGHATHFEEGVPGASPEDIEGLSASEIYGPHACGTSAGIGLPGAVVYSIGCHGGLPVPGSCIADVDHSLDLPQTMMSRGVVAYLANSGYGWGIRYGIGVSERLLQIFSEEATSGGTINLGEVMVRSKQRYFLEQPSFDVYDQKTLLQWTYFGLPMYAVQAGIAPGALAFWTTPPKDRPEEESFGGVRVERSFSNSNQAVALPDFLTQLTLRFDLGAAGVYTKYDSDGTALGTISGCPDSNGCYYTLNGLVERGSGTPDLPIQPYFVYDSRLSGASQHGALWLGGEYREESGWRPVLAELVTNNGDYSDHGSTPRLIHRMPFPQRIETGESGSACRSSDLEINSLATVVGEALKPTDNDPLYSRQRLYQSMDLEAFYFNDQGLGGNCDRQGPLLGPAFGAAYHQVSGTRIDWAVSASDTAGVWRVVVVYDVGADPGGVGHWRPFELALDSEGIWRGGLTVPGVPRLTYMIQAVDRRGNVDWVDFVTSDLPASGFAPDLPMPFDVSLATADADLKVQVSDAPDPVSAGNVFAYSVVVTNLGPGSANEVIVTGSLPVGAMYGAAAGEGWSCAHQAGTVTCSRSSLAPGVASIVSIFLVAPSASGTLTGLISAGALEVDPVMNNNSAVVQTFVATGADLSVSKSDGGALARPGQPLSYTIAVNNYGPEDAVGATVTDLFPVDLFGVSWTCVATPGSACTAFGNGDIVDEVDIRSGGTLIYQATATVVAQPEGPIENTATIVAPANVGDSQQANNMSTVSTPLFDLVHIFADGFESGDLSAWSTVVPFVIRLKDELPEDLSRFQGNWSSSAALGPFSSRAWVAVLEPEDKIWPAVVVALSCLEGEACRAAIRPVVELQATSIVELEEAPEWIELDCLAKAKGNTERGNTERGTCRLVFHGDTLEILVPVD